MKFGCVRPWARSLVLLSMLWGCAGNTPQMIQSPEFPQAAPQQVPAQELHSLAPVPHEEKPRSGELPRTSWTFRVITEAELLDLGMKDPDLSPSFVCEILARLNARARYYVDQDIKDGKPMKVPDDFKAYKAWTPLPKSIPEVTAVPKFILVVKDIPFLGWYQDGNLVGDTMICVGKSDDWTRAGVYRVENKDADHISRSYTNAYGVPAPMPNALRIYEHVWIHTGDIAAGYCSHGCINLPMMPSISLFKWADVGTPVVVLQSLVDLHPVLARNRSNCMLHAQECAAQRRGD